MVYSQALVFGNGVAVMSDEDSVVQSLLKLVHPFTSSDKRVSYQRSLETSSEYSEENQSSSMEWLDSGMNVEHCVVETIQLELTRQIELCLSEAKSSRLHCKELLLPRRLTARVARDIMRASAEEPCGLRGAVILVLLETKQALQLLGSVTPEQSVTPTFELSVVFKADPDVWPALKHLFVTDKVLRLCSSYRLVKRKLYSSASPVIQEFT